MKAYIVREKNSSCFTVVFAESSTKARFIAMHTDACEDVPYIDICAKRMPMLDKYYRGESEMDWYNAEDRIAMVKEVGFSCSLDYWEEEDCKSCPAKQWCDRGSEVAE